MSKKKLYMVRILTAILSAAGFIISSYLTYIHYASAKSFCDLSETVSCDVVTTSIYSEVFGIPLSILGMGYFAIVFIIVLVGKNRGVFQPILLLSAFVLMPSYYLTGIEIFVLKAYCILCELSKLLMVGIAVISIIVLKWKLSQLGRMIAPVVIAGIAASAVTYFAQTAVSTKTDYSSFVDSLNKKGVVYYKSVKCSNCRRQEKLLGKAYPKLNSVECHPEGKNPQPELCLSKGIKKTPTFLLEKDGQEIKRLEGLQQIKNIANWAEVPLEE